MCASLKCLCTGLVSGSPHPPRPKFEGGALQSIGPDMFCAPSTRRSITGRRLHQKRHPGSAFKKNSKILLVFSIVSFVEKNQEIEACGRVIDERQFRIAVEAIRRKSDDLCV